MLVNSYCLLPVGVDNPVVLFVLFVPDYLSGLPGGKLARTASAFPQYKQSTNHFINLCTPSVDS